MNLKDRGITVGDLLLIIIITISTIVIIKTFKTDGEDSINSAQHKTLFINKFQVIENQN